MDSYFIDATIFLRYLTADDSQAHQACLSLLQQAERNEVNLVTSEGVISQVVYALSSPKHYQLSRSRIKVALSRLLLLLGLKMPQRQVCLRALDLYAKHPLDFEDCLALAHMDQQNLTQIYSYDRGFDRIAGIQRLEPESLENGIEAIEVAPHLEKA